MNINPIQSYGRYQSFTKGVQKVKTIAAMPESSGKTDQVSFSANAIEQKDISQVPRSILREMNEPENASRLNALRDAVENHTYYVSSDDLADAILGHAYI